MKPAFTLEAAERAHAASIEEATAAHTAHARAESAEEVAHEAVERARVLEQAARESHESAVKAADAADAAWSTSQTAPAWNKVEAARSLRDQAELRARGAKAALVGAESEHATAVSRLASARAAAEASSVRRDHALDVLTGLRADANAASDQIAAERGARVRAAAAYDAAREALVNDVVRDAAPVVVRYVETAAALARVGEDISQVLGAARDRARAIVGDARAAHALAAGAPFPAELAFGATGSELGGAALALALPVEGDPASVLGRLAHRGPVTVAERALLGAALPAVTVTVPAPTQSTFAAAFEELHRLGVQSTLKSVLMVWGDVSRALAALPYVTPEAVERLARQCAEVAFRGAAEMAFQGHNSDAFAFARIAIVMLSPETWQYQQPDALTSKGQQAA